MGASKGQKDKTDTNTNTLDKRTKRPRRHETFFVYIYKALKQVHQDTGISKRSMAIMNSFINDILERISLEAYNLVRHPLILGSIPSMYYSRTYCNF